MISPGNLQRVMQRPALVEGVGRLLGFGQAEQQAIARGKFPAWALVVVALGAGAVAGAYAQRRWRIV